MLVTTNRDSMLQLTETACKCAKIVTNNINYLHLTNVITN